MKGISAKIIADEKKVRMHTNFAEFKNVSVGMAHSDIATWSKENGVLKIHTNTIYSWGIYAICTIPKNLLKAGQKYGISVRSNHRFYDIALRTADSTHGGKIIGKPHWDGEKISAVVMLEETDIVDGLGIKLFPPSNNTDYEFRDFRIWEIDDLEGGGSNS